MSILTVRLWNSLPAECFPLTYDLNCLKYRVNRQILSLFFSRQFFIFAFNLFHFCYFHAVPRIGCSALSESNTNQKEKLINVLFFCSKFIGRMLLLVFNILDVLSAIDFSLTSRYL